MSCETDANPFSASARFAGQHVHLGICGSVACYKAADLLRALINCGVKVSATLSAGCREFITPLLIRSLGADPVYGEMFSGSNPFAHLEPGQKCECMLVAPASADMLAQLAAGFAREMLSAQYLAFSGNVVIAPAMNPAMWAHPATQANVGKLGSRGAVIVPPGVGKAACGTEGQGRLADLGQIFLACLKALSTQDMEGLKVMVTLGPTREPWDRARFWSNPSSGRMGAALATASWLRGANVTAICGPGINVCLPDAINCIHVQTAKEMFAEARRLWPQMDVGLFAAAVADFAPLESSADVKMKKDGKPERFEISFGRNPDILTTLGEQRKPGQRILGFAAEVAPDIESVLPLAESKLKQKKADIIAGNRINAGDCAFGALDAGMAVVDKNGRQETWSPQPKADIAWDLLTWLLKI